MSATLIGDQAEAFKRWFASSGHWVYDYRSEAVRVWRERGINGRPRWSPSLDAVLASWVAADPLPAILARAA